MDHEYEASERTAVRGFVSGNPCKTCGNLPDECPANDVVKVTSLIDSETGEPTDVFVEQAIVEEPAPVEARKRGRRKAK